MSVVTRRGCGLALAGLLLAASRLRAFALATCLTTTSKTVAQSRLQLLEDSFESPDSPHPGGVQLTKVFLPPRIILWVELHEQPEHEAGQQAERRTEHQ